MSSSVFASIVDTLSIASLPRANRTVSIDEFNDFDKHYLLDVLRDIPYGVAFCKKFNIVDFVLITTPDWMYCSNYIKDHYVK